MEPANDSAQLTWVTGLPMPRAAADQTYRLELAIRSDDDPDTGAAPFVQLDDNGRFSRVLLARLAGTDGAEVVQVALKLQRDLYRVPTAAAALVDNGEVEAMWRRECDHLQRLGGRSAPRVFALGCDRGPLPPLAYDRRTRRLFRVVSPASWAPLRVCRDDALLRDAGLEPWSGSTTRYLHCPDDAGPRTFYAWSTKDGAKAAAGVRIVHREQLYLDLATAWAALPDDRRMHLARQLPDVAAVLAELPPDEVLHRVVPLNYFEAHAFAVELQDLHFDEYCDLAGGATVSDLAAAAELAGGPGRRMVFDRLTPGLAADQQWLTAPWLRGDQLRGDQLRGDQLSSQAVPERSAVGRLAIEAAFLKLHAFVQVAQAVREFHQTLDRPHLGMSADNVMVRCCGQALPVPWRWRFQASLVDVGASHRLQPAGLEQPDGVPELLVPSTDAVQSYLSPLAAPASVPRELAMQARATALVEADVQVGLRIELRTARERLDGIEVGDVVGLVPDAPLAGFGDQSLFGQVTAVAKDVATIAIRLPADSSPPVPGRIDAPGDPLVFHCTATFHRRLRQACDLFSLGMLLARALLCHDQRDVFAVRELWDRMLDKMDMMLGGAGDGRRAEAVLHNLLDGERTNLGSESVLWPAALRRAAAEPIPAALWRNLLMLIGRLLTNRRGFSYAAHHGDDGGGMLLDVVLRDAQELLARLQIEATDQGGRSAEIGGLVQQLAAEVSAALVGGGRPDQEAAR